MSEEHKFQSQIICVLGMHRSGTSLITRIINLFGVYLGPQEHLIKPQEDNPKGFWENQAIKELNDEILNRLGGSWHDPPIFPAGWESLPDLADIRRSARNLMQQDFSASNLWGWKDPRACLTLPFWQKLLPPMRYVICLRNPVDVARSLEGRENLPLQKCITLWLAYVKSSLDHTAGQPRLLVFFEDLMTQRGEEVERLAHFLGHPGKSQGSSTLRAGEESIDEDLQHYRTPLIDLVDNPELSFPAKALYMALRLHIRPAWNQTGTDGTQKLPEVIDNFSRYAFDAYLEQDTLQGHLGELEGQSIEQQQRLTEMSRDREQLVEEAAQLKHQLSASRNQEEQLAQEIILVRSALADEATKVGQANDKIDDLENELTQANCTIGSLKAELAEANERISGLDTALSQERSRAERLLSDADRALSEKESALLALRRQSEAELRERDRAIESLQLTQSGLFWELLSAYRGAKDRRLPPGTKRRVLYDRGLRNFKALWTRTRSSGLVFLMAKHPVRTLRNLNRVNINKFFYHVQHSDTAVVGAKLERKLGLDQPARKHVEAKLQKFGLIISGCPGDAYRYRCEHQAEQLRFLGLTVDIAYFDHVDYRKALEGYQCYWLHRVPHTDVVEDFILKAQYMGKPVIFDSDDLVFDEEKIPYIRALKWMSQDEVDLYIDGVRRYHRTLSLCRFATVTTEPLRDAVQRLSPAIRCFINPNALSDAQLAHAEAALKTSRPAEDKDIVRIGYFSGTRTHNVDFQESSRALVRVLENYPNVKVMFVGHLDVGEEFKRFGDRIERYPLLPWQELPRLLRRVDINVAPLELDNPFTEAKSALKYFEAAVIGVPTVASDVKAYQASIRHGENGFLCRTEEDWAQCLARLVKDASLRREMGRRAKTDTLERLTTRRQTPHFRSAVKEIFQAGSPSSEKTLSIAFVLRAPIGQVGGGYKNIFRLVNYLADQGHEVNVYVEPIAHLEGKSDSQIIEFCHMYFGESAAEIHVGHDAIKTCDVAIATNWPTAFVVDSLTNTLCKAYLIQDFEPDFYDYESPLHKEAEKTYDLSLKKITLGRHLANLFESKDQLPVASIDFGIDHGIFNNHNRKESEDKVRILFFARPALKRRGFDLGIEALEQVYRNCSTVEIYCYGMEEKKVLPFPYTNLGVLPPAELAKAMCNADIHLSFSFTNISFVPFEAMACGCAVVEAKVPPVQAMVEDGTNCVLAEPTANAVAEALLRLVKNSDLRRGIVEAGVEFVQKKTWDNSCEQFRETLINSLFLRPSLEGVVLTNSKSLIGSDTHDSNAPLSNKHEIASVSLPCNLCGSEGYKILYGDIPQVYINSFVVACADCGLKRLEPRMASTDELWSSTSTYIHRDYIPCWSNLGCFQPDGSFDPKGNFHYWHVNVLARIENFRQNGRLLDLGCNIGLLVEAANRAGWEATGIDISEPAIRYGKEKFRVDLRVGQIQDCIFPDEYFDVISLWDVIEHLTDPIGALKSAWTLLRPGGALVIQTPNYAGPSRRLLGKRWEMFATEHFFYFDETTLKRMLESAGFNEIKFETLGFDRAKVVSILGEDSALLQNVDEELKTGHFGLDTIIVRAQKPIEPIAIHNAGLTDKIDSRPERPIIFQEHRLAHTLLDGLTGLEIGAAAHNPFGLRTRNVCHPESYQAYAEEQQREMGVAPAPVDVWASAENIPVSDASEDFIISSHVVEHLPNLILTFVEWNRIVRDGGYVFIIVPQKGALAEDATRDLTSLAHLVNDYHRGLTLETHLIDGVPGGRMGHYHTFTPDSLLQVVKWMATNRLCDWALVAREDVDTKTGNGFTLAFQIRHGRVCTD